MYIPTDGRHHHHHHPQVRQRLPPSRAVLSLRVAAFCKERKDTPPNGQLATLPHPTPLLNRLISPHISTAIFHLICLIPPRPVPLIHPCPVPLIQPRPVPLIQPRPVPAIYRAPPRPVLYYAILLSHARAMLLRVLVNIFLCVFCDMFIMYALLPLPSNLNLNLSARLAVRSSSSFRFCPFLYPLPLLPLSSL